MPEDAALEDCAQYKGEQENELKNTQEPADPQKDDQEGDQEAQPEEIKPTEPTEEPAVQEEPTVQEKPQVAAKVAANNKAAGGSGGAYALFLRGQYQCGRTYEPFRRGIHGVERHKRY